MSIVAMSIAAMSVLVSKYSDIDEDVVVLMLLC